MTPLPTDDAERSKIRLHDYDEYYFPNAHVAKALHSYESNQKHNGCDGMTWNKDKSIGDGNQIRRHLKDGFAAYHAGDMEEARKHLTALAWRADELLERFLTKLPPFDSISNDALSIKTADNASQTMHNTSTMSVIPNDDPPEVKAGLPKLPDGWVYYGLGPIAGAIREWDGRFGLKDVMVFRHGMLTDVGYWGRNAYGYSPYCHYALRKGSDIAKINGL